jgi:GT2 family glycosyltransferase
MTPTISVLLPTIRPDRAKRALASVDAACGSVPYEVVVVADFPPNAMADSVPCAHLRWVQRERYGVVDAVNVACCEARGEYLFLFNDESVLQSGALQALYAEATPTDIVTVRHEPSYPFVYYGLPFAPFPFAHRDLLRSLGGLLDPVYRGFYADPDLSLRAHAAGVPIRVIESAVLRHDNDHDAAHRASVDAYLLADRATFRSRWDHLGEFHDP